MNILLVGSGVIGSSVLHEILSISADHNIVVCYDNSGRKDNVSVNGNQSIYRSSNFGGLGEFWHGVADMSYLADLGYLPKESLPSNSRWEMVPWRVSRPHKKKNVVYRCDLAHLDVFSDFVRASFDDRSFVDFDIVFICHGVLPYSDVLVKSGLANSSTSVSDHLVFTTNRLSRKKRFDLVYTGKGVLRPYDLIETSVGQVKCTQRPVFGFNHIDPSSKMIYSSVNSYLSVLKHLSLRSAFQASNLRFGFPDFVGIGQDFYQIAVDDLFINDSGLLRLNQNSYFKVRDELCNFFELDDIDFMSGIHHWNSYSSIDSLYISNRTTDMSKRIFLLTSQFDFPSLPFHFTQFLVEESKTLVRDLFL